MLYGVRAKELSYNLKEVEKICYDETVAIFADLTQIPRTETP